MLRSLNETFWALVLVFVFCNGLNAQMIVAHRGASFDAPENTIAAFKLAWEENADAIEGDFHLTADGKVVCIHDKDTLETAGVKKIVAESTLEQLRVLDVGSWAGLKFKDERIPTLEQVLELVPTDKKIFIEIKSGPETIPVVAACIKSSDVKVSQIVIISFGEDVIAASKKQLPDIPANWLTSFEQDEETGVWSPNVQEVLLSAKKCGADGIGIKGVREVVDENFVNTIRREHRGLHCWTIDEPDDAEYFQSLGFDSITTNRPEYIRHHLEKSGKTPSKTNR